MNTKGPGQYRAIQKARSVSWKMTVKWFLEGIRKGRWTWCRKVQDYEIVSPDDPKYETAPLGIIHIMDPRAEKLFISKKSQAD